MDAIDDLLRHRSTGICTRCNGELYIYPLHLDEGGPLVCLPCGCLLHMTTMIEAETQDHDSQEAAVGRKVLERFNQHNNDRQAQGNALREAIRGITDARTGPKPLTAEGVLNQLKAIGAQRLGRPSLPTLRTVQVHLQTLRGR